MLAAALLTGAVGTSFAAGQDTFDLEIPFEAPRAAECDIGAEVAIEDPQVVFPLMRTSEQQAVACAAMLEANVPGWEQQPGASELVAPFVSYLLGDGTARGLQRHEIFLALLGHLEAIEPGWRYSQALEPFVPEMILGSVVEDPFVADFWARTLPEANEDWQDSEAADAVLPAVYELAASEAEEPAATRNTRPMQLLKKLSWPSYARLVLATRVFDTWLKRVAFLGLAIGIVTLLVGRVRRRKHT